MTWRLVTLAAALAGVSPVALLTISADAQHTAYGPEAQLQVHIQTDELDPGELAALDPDLAFALRLHMLRGHLAAAKVLASQNRFKEAAGHTSHALHISLPPLEPELARRGLPSLRDELLAVNAAANSGEGQLALLSATRPAELRIWKDYDTIPEHRRQSVAFNLSLALLLFKEAAQQYEAAWQGLRLTHLHEFQNGYGFLMEARWLLARSLPVLRKEDVKIATNIEGAYLRLREAWPSIDPPPKPVMPYSTINGLVAAIEINANRL
ncbi:MAG: hypothetical protein JNJ53_08815 [Rhizobiales bacterium]|nr:hypothetical protein [Hyphomicrobiales bacterium]